MTVFASDKGHFSKIGTPETRSPETQVIFQRIIRYEVQSVSVYRKTD